MADFNTGLAEPRGAGANPVHAVKEHVPNTDSPLLNLGVGLASVFAKNLGEMEKQRKEEEKQRVISEFTQTQTSLNDAVKQGAPSAKIAAMSRANFSKFAANNPSLVEDFTKIQRSLTEFTEIGSVVDEQKMMQDERKQLRKDYLAAGGFIPSGASAEYENQALMTFQQVRQQTAAFELQAKKNAEERAKEGADRSRIDFDNKQSAGTLLNNIGSQHLALSQQFIQDAAAKAKKGDIEGATRDLNVHFSNIEGALASASAYNPELAGPWRTLFDQLKKSGESAISGKLESDALKQQLETTLNKAKLVALQDKQMLGVTVSSQLLNGQLPALFWESNKAAQNALLSVAGGGNTPILGNPENEKLAFSTLEHNIKLLESGKVENPESTMKEVANVANGYLKQIGSAASLSGFKPDQLKNAANFLASPIYAKIVEKGMVDKEANAAASDAMLVLYNKNVVKQVTKIMDEPLNISSTAKAFGFKTEKEMSMSDAVDFKWNGAAVAMAPKPVDRAYQSELNTRLYSLKPAEAELNKMIKMGAHIEGHTNYAKFWEENKHNMLPNVFPDPNKLAVGQVVTAKNGKKYKYIGGNYNDIDNSYIEVRTDAPE